MELTLAHCDTPSLRREAIDALAFKCDVLWAILDATAAAPAIEGDSRRLAMIDLGPEPSSIETARPRLAPGVRLARDSSRNGWALLGPESVRPLYRDGRRGSRPL